MTFQTFKRFVLMSVFFMTTSVVIYAQQSTMQGLIGQSLAKLQQPTSESILNCIAEMKRIDDMFPDSIQPKFQIALQSLNYSVMNPHAPQTENLLKETEETIAKMENIKHADPYMAPEARKAIGHNIFTPGWHLRSSFGWRYSTFSKFI